MNIQKKSPLGTNSEAMSGKQTPSWLKLPMLLLMVAIGIVLVAGTAMADSSTATGNAAPAVATPPPVIYVGPQSGGSIKNPTGAGGTLKFANEDILRCSPNGSGGCNWELYFDGSDVGLGPVKLQDFEILADGIIFAIDRSFNIPGLSPKATSHDIIKFTPTSLGATTAGTFSYYFRGETAGLNKAIDAVALTPGNKLVISLEGSGNLPKTGGGTLSVKDEDLIQLDGTTWSLYLKGSSFGLTSGTEDIAAAWIDPSSTDHDLYVATKGHFSAHSVNSISGTHTDVFGIAPTSSDPITSGFLFPFFDAKANGEKKGFAGLSAVPGDSLVAQQAVVTSASDDSAAEADAVDEAPDMSEADASDTELDANDYIDVQASIYLPYVRSAK